MADPDQPDDRQAENPYKAPEGEQGIAQPAVLKREMKLTVTVILPCVFIVAELALVYLFGAAGHGWGIEAGYWLAAPASVLLGSENVTSLLIAGMLQYTIVGGIVDIAISTIHGIRCGPKRPRPRDDRPCQPPAIRDSN